MCERLTTRSKLPKCLSVILMAVLPQPGVAAGDKADRPNIILCMADDQGWGEM